MAGVVVQRRLVPQQEAFSKIGPMTGTGLTRIYKHAQDGAFPPVPIFKRPIGDLELVCLEQLRPSQRSRGARSRLRVKVDAVSAIVFIFATGRKNSGLW